MKYVILTGRFLYSLIFTLTVVNYFSAGAITLAASLGMPAANFIVPILGILAIVGALCIIIGYKAKVGAWLIVIFLVPVTIFMHPFWKGTGLFQAEIHLAMFAKNISLLGGALIITYFGAGPMSFDKESGFRIRLKRFSDLESPGWPRERLQKYV